MGEGILVKRGSKFNFGGATGAAAQLLSGYKMWNNNGELVDGGMTNRGAVSNALAPGGTYTIPAGYHNGGGKVTTNLAGATGAAAQLLSGYKMWNNANGLVTGSMANRGAVSATIDPGGSYTIPAGYHTGSGKVTANTAVGNIRTVIIDQNTTWVVPNAKDQKFSVRIFGGGGTIGGGGGNMNNAILTLTAGSTIPITIGDGGFTFESSYNVQAGGTTTFGSYLSATGGEGGSGGNGGTGGGGGRGNGGRGYYGGGGGAGRSMINLRKNGTVAETEGPYSGGAGGTYGGGGGGSGYGWAMINSHTASIERGTGGSKGTYGGNGGSGINGYSGINTISWAVEFSGAGLGGNGDIPTESFSNRNFAFSIYSGGGGGGGYGGNGGNGGKGNEHGSSSSYINIEGGAGGGGGGYGGKGGDGSNSGSRWVGGGGGGYGNDGDSGSDGGGGGGYGPSGYGHGGSSSVNRNCNKFNGGNGCGMYGICIIQYIS